MEPWLDCSSALGYEMQSNFPVAKIEWNGELESYDDNCQGGNKCPVQTLKKKKKSYIHKRERKFGTEVVRLMLLY